MNTKTLEQVSLDEFLAHFPPDRIVIPTGWSQIGMAIKNARFDGWNACLARMTPIIEQRERERLAKLAEHRGQDHAFCVLTADEILAGKLEDGK